MDVLSFEYGLIQGCSIPYDFIFDFLLSFSVCLSVATISRSLSHSRCAHTHTQHTLDLIYVEKVITNQQNTVYLHS